MVKTMTDNPVRDWSDERLKSRFSTTYAEVYLHGIDDGVNVRSKLKLMELELKSRGFDPADIVGPKVIAAD